MDWQKFLTKSTLRFEDCYRIRLRVIEGNEVSTMYALTVSAFAQGFERVLPAQAFDNEDELGRTLIERVARANPEVQIDTYWLEKYRLMLGADRGFEELTLRPDSLT